MNNIDMLADHLDDMRRPRVLPPSSPAPFVWPASVAPREWLYGRHYIRRFISATIAPGGVGKSSLIIAELLAMVTGRSLLGITPHEPLKAWYWNGEDPTEELHRRIVATARYYQIQPIDLQGRLFVDSGRENEIVIAVQTRDGATVSVPVIDAMVSYITQQKIDVLVIDPFVACHRVQENDNNAIEEVASAWAEIADRTGCAVELVHHSRKTNDGVTIEDARGASALLAKARSARVLNVMTDAEAKKADLEPLERRRYFRVENGKANLARPSTAATWHYLESLDLQNATASRPSDQVGVVISWSWPATEIPEVTSEQLLQIQMKVGHGMSKVSLQAGDWAGKAVAEVLGLAADDAMDKAVIKSMLKRWENDGTFGIQKTYNKKKGREVPEYRVMKWVII